MKALFAIALLCAYAIYVDLAFTVDSYVEGVWEDNTKELQSVKLNGKIYQCDEAIECDCPKLLCTGDKDCVKKTSNVRCQLNKEHNMIDLNNAQRPFFGGGDCECRTL